MCVNCAQPGVTPAAKALPYGRWLLLAGCLLAEVLVVEGVVATLRFGGGTGAGPRGWWEGVLAYSPFIPQAGLAMATALLVFGGARLRDELGRVAQHLPLPHAAWPYFFCHLLAFAGFVLVSAHLFQRQVLAAPSPGGWVLAWLTLALATIGFWAAAALPPGLWLSLTRRHARALLAAILIGAAAWGAGLATSRFWQPLAHSTLWVVHKLLGCVYPETFCGTDDLIVGTPSFAVEVAPFCSGYQGIGLIWFFLGAYLWFFRQELRFPQALLLLPLGTGVIWLANAVRIAALVAVGTSLSPRVAAGGFHSQAGWLAFNAVALGLVAGTRQARFFRVREPGARPARAPNATAAYLAPLLMLVAATMLTRAFSDGFDWLYPLRVLAVAAALWLCRRGYAPLGWSWSWPAVALGVLAFGVWLALVPAALDPVAGTALAAGLGQWPAAAGLWLGLRVLGSVLTVPLAEELAFRGYLPRRLLAAEFQQVPLGRFSGFSFLVSSLLFGMLHDHWLAGTLSGMLFAVAVYRRGKLADAVLAHATTNALIAAYVLCTGTWSLWA